MAIIEKILNLQEQIKNCVSELALASHDCSVELEQAQARIVELEENIKMQNYYPTSDTKKRLYIGRGIEDFVNWINEEYGGKHSFIPQSKKNIVVQNLQRLINKKVAEALSRHNILTPVKQRRSDGKS